MKQEYSWCMRQSPPLYGSVCVDGAKNSVLVILAALVLTRGTSYIYHVPDLQDVHVMLSLLQELGAIVHFNTQYRYVIINTEDVCNAYIPSHITRRMRASLLVMGPLLARFSWADVALPGGCVIGKRPIDLHLHALRRIGATIARTEHRVHAQRIRPRSSRIVLDYPSVGATENALMVAVVTRGVTRIVNASLEPEVYDLITVLRKMGACITIQPPAMIEITGVDKLMPVEHTVMPDRLEAGTILLAAAATGGHVAVKNAPADTMEALLDKLYDMGHTISVGERGHGVSVQATASPQAISLQTGPYPGFPTDLQAPIVAVLMQARGVSHIIENVYERRMQYIQQLHKLGACITTDGRCAQIEGVAQLSGNHVHAPDIRGGAALVIAGLMARGRTELTGIEHLHRGHASLMNRLAQLGAPIHEDICVWPPREGRWLDQQALG